MEKGRGKMSNGIYINFEGNTLYLDIWSSRWQEGERSCICVLGGGGIDFASFYYFSIGFWNCSGSVVFKK